MGEVTFEVAQVRPGGFYPSALGNPAAASQAGDESSARCTCKVVSTRKVIEVLQNLVGPEVSISSTQISRYTALLDAGLHAWRSRPLDETRYVILDARYERVREAGRVLGVSVALSEAEVHWAGFFGQPD